MSIARYPSNWERHGMTKSSEHTAWVGMKGRCYNTNDKDFPHYGGRGIGVYKEWQESFTSFLKHVGKKPSPKHSLDRIDVNGDYVPGNVRWATHSQQSKNQQPLQSLVVGGFEFIYDPIIDSYTITHTDGELKTMVGKCEMWRDVKKVARSLSFMYKYTIK